MRFSIPLQATEYHRTAIAYRTIVRISLILLAPLSTFNDLFQNLQKLLEHPSVSRSAYARTNAKNESIGPIRSSAHSN